MIGYIWVKLLTRLRGAGTRNSTISPKSKLGAGSIALNTNMGRYSYCGSDCLLSNVEIGNFCSIGNDVIIGGGTHPLHWVSTSPAFYKGRDSISKRLATLHYDYRDVRTIIGSDVWIAQGVYIKAGVTIGCGAVIGMGAVVTKDVEPYTIVAGNPAKKIGERFESETVEKLMNLKWWEWEEEKLLLHSKEFNDIDLFLRNGG